METSPTTTAPATGACDILKGARELLAEPAHWTTGEMARRQDGQYTGVMTPGAAKFCLLGALARVAGVAMWGAGDFQETMEEHPALREALCRLTAVPRVYGEAIASITPVYTFNDRYAECADDRLLKSHHKDVVAALDEAIAGCADPS